MNLIDRYVTEVGKHLPMNSRTDIEKELKSTLEDMLEDRSRQSGKARDEAMELELLKEYGSPAKVAATYHSTQYLIGPRMYPIFMLVLKIVSSVLGVMAIVGLSLALSKVGFAGREFSQILMRTVGEYVGIAISAFGNIVVVFAILDRTLSDSDIQSIKTDEEWDPAILLKEQDPDTVKRGDLIAEIIFTFAGLVILNFYPQILGMTFVVDGEWFFIPIFSAAFFAFLPWINLTFLAEIGLDLYLLRQGAWSMITRAVKVILETASLTVTILIFRTPGIIGFTAESFANSPVSAETAEKLTSVFTWIFPLILIIIMIVQGMELAKAAFGLWKINYKTK